MVHDYSFSVFSERKKEMEFDNGGVWFLFILVIRERASFIDFRSAFFCRLCKGVIFGCPSIRI